MVPGLGWIMVKRVLMVAFHYPPCAGSSGLQRALKFSRYLGAEGWEPLVLSVSPGAYPKISDSQMKEIPQDIVVERSFCLDTARHLAVAGHYPKVLALPDRWSSWRFSGIRKGMQLIEHYRPQLIWSTYPIATAHFIANQLHIRSGLPWVADFRDSMTEPGYPADLLKRKQYQSIERHACENASAVVFTAPGALRMYVGRYPDLPADHWVEIANGYDEENFTGTDDDASGAEPIKLLHSGIIYPSERDPTHFFDALADLANEGLIDPDRLQVVLRATGHDEQFAPMLAARDLTGIVKLEPAIDYDEALKEMMAASGLLLFQASNCNHQIPAKLYEYMRAAKPVLGLTDPAGDTASRMREVGLVNIVQLDDKHKIKSVFIEFLRALNEKTAPLPDPRIVQQYSRQAQATRLAELFGSVCKLRHA